MKNAAAMYRTRNHHKAKKKESVYHDFGSRSTVTHKPFQTKAATSVVARAVRRTEVRGPLGRKHDSVR